MLQQQQEQEEGKLVCKSTAVLHGMHTSQHTPPAPGMFDHAMSQPNW